MEPVGKQPNRIDPKWFVLLSVGVGTFMSALDSSVANVVLPVLRNAFKSDIPTVEWIVTIYLLVVSGLLLSFGRLGDIRGHKLTYSAGYGIFLLGSIFCGLSPTVQTLIAFRVLQALGAAMLFANAPAILTGNFPPEQRGQALGLQATMTYLGLTVGPSLGGWLTDQFSWRAVFFINIPVGLLGLMLSLRFIPIEEKRKRTEPFDFSGAFVFMAGLVSLLLAMNQGEAWGWGSPAVIGMILLGIVLLVVFVRIEQHKTSPMLDLSLFKIRLFSASTASAVFNYICLYSVIFLMPFYLIQGRGLSTGQAGLLLTAQPLIMAIAAPISGTLSDRIGSRSLSTFGMGVIAAGLFLLSQLNDQSPFWFIMLSLAVVGLGIGIFISPNNNALMGSAPHHRQGIAAGVLATARNVGMVLGVGLAGAVFTTFISIGTQQGASHPLLIGIRASFLVAAGISILGMFTSALRGQHTAFEEEPKDLSSSSM